jgi:hypothetical protein
MQPTYLYIKQHTVTGLKYFGKTTKNDPYKYKGSGLHWSRHLNKYGRKQVITIWVSEPFVDEDSLVEFATFISEELDIVNSDKWANLIIENGIDGAVPGICLSKEHKAKISNSLLGKTVSDETKARMSIAQQLMTNETKTKISVAKLGVPLSEEHKAKMRKPKSEEHRKKLSIAKLGKIYGPRGPYKKKSK